MIHNRRTVFYLLSILLAFIAVVASILQPGMLSGVAGGKSPQDGLLRITVNRDTWVSSARNEQQANLGGGYRLKTKGIQEFIVLDADLAPAKRRVILGAKLHLRHHSGAIQRRLTVSSLARDWVEGTSTGYRSQVGSASFKEAAQGSRAWIDSGGDITSVCLGRGNTIWGFAEATTPNRSRWQSIPVRPAVVAARLAGISHGFVIMDDVGSEYERDGERFKFKLFPNRFVYSHESGRRNAPYLTLELGPADHEPPGPVRAITFKNDRLPPGEAIVWWDTPDDRGPAGTIGFHVRASRVEPFAWSNAEPVPRYVIPMAGQPGDTVAMQLGGPGFSPGEVIHLGICAVDAAGNVGPIRQVRIVTAPDSPQVPVASAKVPPPAAADASTSLPRLGRARVAVLDVLDKVHPRTGKTITNRPSGYRRSNHLWSAADRRIRLSAARNEHVAFQVLLDGPLKEVSAELTFDAEGVAPLPRLYHFRHVQAAGATLPDPLVPLSPSGRVPTGSKQGTAVVAEVYIPHGMDAGTHHGELLLTTLGAELRVAIELRVWDFTLPDQLSFIPQMNCYGLPGPPVDRAYYRLAHVHRTCLNRLPYNWQGRVHDGYAPKVRGDGSWDWSVFDKRFGPLLDGTAFEDLPRKGVPVEAFYIPLNENWPVPIEPHFTQSYWADDALGAGYREKFVAASARFAEHFRERGWTDTFFEFYLNNKLFFKKKDNWGYCSAPWIFDEPVNTQDFWALRWFGIAFHEGVSPVRGDVKMAYRCDISRPQWQRDLLDGVMDVNVVGGTVHQYRRRVLDRKRANGEIAYLYGSANRIEESNVQPAAWCIDAWTMGLDGVIPWQTLGKNGSWKQADPFAIFYPGNPIGRRDPVASIRLKAFRRGQQDVEYLTILAEALGRPRWEIEQWARTELGLRSTFIQTSENDAGTVSYDNITPERLWQLRTRVGSYLDEVKPLTKRRWVDLRTPVRDVDGLKRVEFLVETK